MPGVLLHDNADQKIARLETHLLTINCNLVLVLLVQEELKILISSKGNLHVMEIQRTHLFEIGDLKQCFRSDQIQLRTKIKYDIVFVGKISYFISNCPRCSIYF